MERREVLEITRSLRIPLSEIKIRATTSSGPGGQHVNRSQTRIEAQFDVVSSKSLGPRQRERLLEKLGPIVKAVASDERSQTRNRQTALDRLGAKLSDALKLETPRRPTSPTRGSVTRRLESKRKQSQQKQQRRHINDD